MIVLIHTLHSLGDNGNSGAPAAKAELMVLRYVTAEAVTHKYVFRPKYSSRNLKAAPHQLIDFAN
jgi:hypothetical protein